MCHLRNKPPIFIFLSSSLFLGQWPVATLALVWTSYYELVKTIASNYTIGITSACCNLGRWRMPVSNSICWSASSPDILNFTSNPNRTCNSKRWAVGVSSVNTLGTVQWTVWFRLSIRKFRTCSTQFLTGLSAISNDQTGNLSKFEHSISLQWAYEPLNELVSQCTS